MKFACMEGDKNLTEADLDHLSFDFRRAPRLEPYKGNIKYRYDLYREQAQSILDNEGGLDEFSKGYEKRGFIVDEKNGVRYTEWAPGVKEARLIGDFSESAELVPRTSLDHRSDGYQYASYPL